MADKIDAPRYIAEGKAFVDKAEAELAAGNSGMAAFYANQAADWFINGIMLAETGNELTGHSLIYKCRQTAHFHKKLMAALPECAAMEPYFYDAEAGAQPPQVDKAAAEKAIAGAKKIGTLV